RHAPAIAPSTIEREAPRHAHEPGAKPIAIAELRERAMRLRKRFLRDVFGVFAMTQDAEGDAKREPRRLGEPRLEFAFELDLIVGRRHRYQAIGKLSCDHAHRPIMPVSTRQDAVVRRAVWLSRTVQSGASISLLYNQLALSGSEC